MSPTTRLYVWGCRGSERDTSGSRSQSKSLKLYVGKPSMNSPLLLGAPRVDFEHHTRTFPCLTAENRIYPSSSLVFIAPGLCASRCHKRLQEWKWTDAGSLPAAGARPGGGASTTWAGPA